jgi:hypothetical protein
MVPLGEIDGGTPIGDTTDDWVDWWEFGTITSDDGWNPVKMIIKNDNR